MGDSIDTAKVLRTVMMLVAMGGGGFGAAEFADVLGTKQWRDANVEKLLQAERDRDRLVALEAQAKVLVRLVERCSGATAEIDVYVPEPVTEPTIPEEEPAYFEWMAIQ